ncbi:PREDICTED: KH domain-containing protein At4g18375 [Brassica oleracea var. oleracea]|uniref:K Homology domain-containing protein n=1 Tax=Brassica oleracea var. oleracea TaxID=109376 RepID=A0A0D3D9F0_BRAOL|nr:PREDICTED: KH domain-containing protein At4g18375 [Brassica oleracea var. oleracea]XP_013598582.1 PREDICTED: KH domain-containing protein At4g18375 [Brassica oleracea var. oleracea]
MVERGNKRTHNRTTRDDNNRNQKRRLSHQTEEKLNNKDDLVVYRILCPSGVIGSVIGKSGKVINTIRQETRARIKVVDPFPGCTERVLTIYCTVNDKKDIAEIENSDQIAPLCSAQDALLKLHDAIVASLATAAENTKIGRDDIRECRLLVPTSQCSNVIGKAGSTVKKVRSRTGANVKIVSKDVSDPSHACAMDFDNIVSISGGAESVKKALFAVSAIMYKFSPKEQIPLDATVQEAPASIIIPSDLSIYPQTGLYQSQDPIFQHGANVPSFIGTLPQGYGETATPVFSSSALPVVHHGTFGGGSSSRQEELVVKVLCSSSNIGRVIGKGGSTIKGIRQASGSRIEVNDSRARVNHDEDCVIIVTSKESPDDLKSMAVEAVLLLQEKINDEDEEKPKMQLLVPSKVIGCIIGKSGSIISEIRKKTNANIYISKENNKCADLNDELVEISGEASNVRDALIQIVLRLRDDVLRDRETTGFRNQQPPARSEKSSFFSSLERSNAAALALTPSFMSSVPQVSPVDFDRRPEGGMSGGLYGYGSFPAGDNSYGSNSSYSSSRYGGLPHPSTTMEIRIPSNAVGKVMGRGGGNLDNIRRISGAMIEISDSESSSHGGRIALISGTPEQKRTAENLFQAFIMST